MKLLEGILLGFILVGAGVEFGDADPKLVGVAGYGIEGTYLSGGVLLAVPEDVEDTRPGLFIGVSFLDHLFAGGYVGGMDAGGIIAGWTF